MMQALLWKEYREHRSVWLTLALLGVLALVAVPAIFAPEGLASHEGLRDSLRMVGVMLAWTYGMVCGAMLLAGEREERTLTFLDSLPVARAPLWVGKALIGALLVLGQLVVLAAAGIGARLVEAPPEVALGLVALALYGLLGLGWGLLCSALCRNVLNAIGLAIAGQFAVGVVVALPALIVGALARYFLGLPPESEQIIAGFIVLVLMTAGPLVLSAWLFTQQDRLRGLRFRALAGGRRAPGERVATWRRLWWLSWAQARGLALGLALFCLAAAFLIPAGGMVLWPALTLGVGALCGVTVFLDEQMGGSFRFLGEQRFPLGRLWVAKVTVRGLMAVGGAVLLLLPAVVLLAARAGGYEDQPRDTPYFARLFHSDLLAGVVPPGLFLVMWLAYGFAVGHLCGLLFHKSLVAMVVSLGVSVLLVSVWVPSLLGGGLRAWQVLGVPLVLLVTGRLLMRPWASGRLVSLGVAKRLGCAVGLCGLWVGGALWYRVTEVPEVPEPAGLADFRASLPTPEENEAGTLTHGALLRLKDFLKSSGRPNNPLFPAAPGEPVPQHMGFPDQALEVVQRGWPGGEPELAGWLDRAFAEDWYRSLVKAAGEPTGVVVDPRRLNVGRFLPELEEARIAPALLVARALQLQARGDGSAFVTHLRSGLALTRNVENKSPVLAVHVASATEGTLLRGLDRWLERLDGKPDLLRRALAELVRHEGQVKADLTEHRLADYVVQLNSLDVPEKLLPRRLAGEGEAESAAVAAAWQVPWERRRLERIVRAQCWGELAQRREASRLAPGALQYYDIRQDHLERAMKRRLCRVRAAVLKVALRLYQAEHGGTAAGRLRMLVPGYISAIPQDPFDGRPFRYRVSRGEQIPWPDDGTLPRANVAPGGGPLNQPAPVAQPACAVLPGQGVLWSVGEDGRDDGGLRQERRGSNSSSDGEDLIFLVPPPPKKPR
jgi:ABC-type transport system involved in multi-copper enzyme maturation permease subunit